MNVSQISSAANTFDSRLVTLEQLLKSGRAHLEEDESSYLQRRLAPDMLPLGAQIAFTCNQPRNFALWLSEEPSDNLDPEVESLGKAHRYVSETRALLANHLDSQSVLPEQKRVDLGPNIYADLTGQEYLTDFLMPNFYFHLVTSYAILRLAGVPLGKKDYMIHLLPKVAERAV